MDELVIDWKARQDEILSILRDDLKTSDPIGAEIFDMFNEIMEDAVRKHTYAFKRWSSAFGWGRYRITLHRPGRRARYTLSHQAGRGLRRRE